MNILENFKKTKIPVVEIFSSISGEGISSGSIVTFVRVAGCNLRCNYCDTKYSYDVQSTNQMSFYEILNEISKYSGKDIICTGGEPLEKDTYKRYLPLFLAMNNYNVRIETNGSVELYSEKELSLFNFNNLSKKIKYTLDVKCPSSGMQDFDLINKNIYLLNETDEIKFVIGSNLDFKYSMNLIKKYVGELKKRKILLNFSPVFGAYEPSNLVEDIKSCNKYFSDKNLNVRLSLQIHKFIWNPNKKGV